MHQVCRVWLSAHDEGERGSGGTSAIAFPFAFRSNLHSTKKSEPLPICNAHRSAHCNTHRNTQCFVGLGLVVQVIMIIIELDAVVVVAQYVRDHALLRFYIKISF